MCDRESGFEQLLVALVNAKGILIAEKIGLIFKDFLFKIQIVYLVGTGNHSLFYGSISPPSSNSCDRDDS